LIIKNSKFFLAILLFTALCSAQWTGLRGSLFLETGYDSNPGILTESQMESFKAGDPYYLNMPAYDDAYTKAGGEAVYRFRIGRARSEMALFYQFAGYLHNSECSYHYIRPSLTVQRRGWHGSVYGKFAFGFATSIYNDVDLSNAAPVWAVYDAYRGGGEIRRDIYGNHSLALDFEYGYSQYNDNFPEYDGANYRIGSAWRWSGPVYIKIAYAYHIYDARAYDIEGQDAETSIKTDISYTEDRLESYISRNLKIARHDFLAGATVDLSQRYYTSEKDFHIDYIHLARRDRRADIAPFIRWDYSSKLSFSVNYSLTIRMSDTPYYDIAPLKDYNRHTISMKADYSFR